MNESIKNFIEEGEKQFEEKWTEDYSTGIICDLINGNEIGNSANFDDIKQFISSRQISLIKMIVEIVENTDEYVEAYDADGHRYQVPKSKKAEWEEWDEYSSSLEEAEETPEWAERIDGLDVKSFKDTISSKLTSLIKE